MAGKKYKTVMLIDDNEIDNLINQKMIEAASITENIYTHTGAKARSNFLKIWRSSMWQTRSCRM